MPEAKITGQQVYDPTMLLAQATVLIFKPDASGNRRVAIANAPEDPLDTIQVMLDGLAIALALARQKADSPLEIPSEQQTRQLVGVG